LVLDLIAPRRGGQPSPKAEGILRRVKQEAVAKIRDDIRQLGIGEGQAAELAAKVVSRRDLPPQLAEALAAAKSR